MKQINIYVDRYVSSVPYLETLKAIEAGQEVINTHCLNFFCFDYLDKGYDVTIISEEFGRIVLSELLENNPEQYTIKEIRKEHNVMKLFVADAFEYKK